MHALVILAVTIAAAFPPVYLLYYYRTVLPRRRREIQVLLTEKVAQSYLEVFAPVPYEKGQPAGEVVVGHFNRFHAPCRYLWTGAMAWLPSVVGLLVCGLWMQDALDGGAGTVSLVPATLIMAFLGGFVWSLYELFSRGQRGDLTPSCLVDIAFRVVASVPIGYACSLLVTRSVGSVVAFVASAFPVRDLRLMLRARFLRQLKPEAVALAAGSREDLLRNRVQGLSANTLARLQEIEISTVVDLAYADPVDLMVKTGFPLRQVIDWMDQSLLALYAGDKMARLAPLGIRSALEASHLYWEVCCNEKWEELEGAEEEPEILKLGTVLGIEPAFAVRMLVELAGDPHVAFLSLLWGET